MATKRFLKGASLLSLSQTTVAVCSFLRNVIIARLISVEDFGIAVMFALVTTLLEMTSNLALDRILVQDDDGHSDAMLASSHALQFVRGVISGLILLLLAVPIAHLFKVPDVAWAFQILALLPVLRGLVHWDMVVHQRSMDFRATAIVDAAPAVLTLFIAWFAALWLRDYRAMLLVVLCQALLMILFSHLLARRPYRWSFRRDLARKKFKFGWPLLVNGLLMFGIFNGDRALVGALFDTTTLGWYGAAFALVLVPGMMFARVCGTLLMPGLSGSKNDPEPFSRQCGLALALCFGCAAFITVFFAIGGKALLLLAFGERYARGNELLMLLALGQAIRIARVAPAMISNSQARTTNAMYSNLVRIIGLPLAVVLALMGFGIEWVALSAILGELLAMAVSFKLVNIGAFHARFLRQSLIMSAGFIVLCVAGYFAFEFIAEPRTVTLGLLLIVAGGLAGLLAAALVPALDPGIRAQARGLLQKIRNRKRAA
jgi:O-antigen/teichoic acid export membrane protein